MKNISIGIIGVGMVGHAVQAYYKGLSGFSVKGYDKYKGIGTFDEAAGADVVFLCLPSLTREDGTQDLEAFEDIVPRLPVGAVAVIKSTVLPGTTERYQSERPDVFFLHNPEFLDERTAARDFAEPPIQVVGTTKISLNKGQWVLKLLPAAPHAHVCTSGESETVKYFMNTFMAIKNTFANQLYDYCAAKGINYDSVKDIVKHAPRMGGEVHLRVFADGYRGFAGMCLPKDLKALVHDAAAHDAPLELLDLVQQLNRSYTQQKSSS